MSLPAPFAPSDASDASSSSSSPRRAPPLASDSDDPSFDLEHVHTSTPRRSGHAARYPLERGGDADDEDPLHASDTESLNLDDADIDRGLRTANAARASTTPPLTRRSLLQLSQPPLASSSARDGPPARLAHSFRRDIRADLYAPSPSTGSSTLVDRDEDLTRKAAGAADDELTLRRARIELSSRRDVLLEEDIEDDAGTVLPVAGGSEDGESSSPRPRRSRVGDLASYVDAKMSSSTPRRSPKHNRHAPTTPAAQGAFPPSARKPSSFRSPSSFSTPHHAQSAALASGGSGGTPASQIHDAFARLITGPDGALAHSAERRATLAAQALVPSPARTAEPPTPHPAGYYAFVPSTSLPVERSPSARRARARSIGEVEGETLAARPTKLERALRHLSQVQRETDEQQGYFRSDGEASAAEQEEDAPVEHPYAGRSAIDFAMARSVRYDGAMQQGDASAEESLSDDADLRASAARRALRASQSVRFASPPAPARTRRRSPSSSPPPPPQSQRQRSTTPPRAPPSPTLPPLPPPLEPDSPEPVRARRPELHLRRSHSSPPLPPTAAASSPPPARPRAAAAAAALAPSPPSLPDPVPPPSPPPPHSPPRRAWTRPASSTPPRGGVVSPPAPASPPAPDLPLHALEQGEQAGDRSAEDTVQLLVGQLAAAVQALTAARAASPPAAATEETPNAQSELRGEIEKRRRESDGRWEAREREMRELEAQEGREAARRAGVLDQLAETYELEQELGFKVDELQRRIEGMGQLVGDQVAHAVGASLRADTRRRTSWLLFALLAQLLLFLFFLRLANSHALALFQTVYHDPLGAPGGVFHLPAPFSLSPFLLPGEPALSLETRAAFAPLGAHAPPPLWLGALGRALRDAVVTMLGARWAPRGGSAGQLVVVRVPS
ncbi:hypothetical protein JCM10449v2_005823 [Rhodotorula kratochvilovae]